MEHSEINLIPVQAVHSARSEILRQAGGRKHFRLVLGFFAPDDNEFSMTLSALAGYVKHELPGVDIVFEPILPQRDSGRYGPAGYARRIAELQPDLLAFTLMSPHWLPMDPYLQALQQALPELPVLVGGYQAILAPEETIAHPAVDFVCTADGEQPLVDLVEALYLKADSSVVQGLWCTTAEGEVVRNAPVLSEDLASMPLPDYGIFEKQAGSMRGVNLSAFGQHEQLILPIITGRGCPYRCTYCCNTPMLEKWRGKATYIRKYDLQKLVDELERLRDHYQVEFFEVWDELFMANMKFAKAFIDLYGKQVGTPFSINARVETMDEAFCRAAADAGCQTMWFGLETGSQRYRNQWLGRRMSNEVIVAAAENARAAGIHRHTFNMVGMPFETQDDMWQTLAINREIEPEFFWFFTYMPLRGTPMYEVTRDNGLLKAENGEDYLAGQREGDSAEDFRLNILAHPEAASEEEFREVCVAMQAFQRQNNRLSFADRRAQSRQPLLPPI